MKKFLIACACACSLFLGCGGSEFTAGEESSDATVDHKDVQLTEAATEAEAAVQDGGADAEAQAEADVAQPPTEAGEEAEAAVPEAGPDVLSEAEVEAEADAEIEAAVDAQIEAEVDAGPDAEVPDAGEDALPEAEAEAEAPEAGTSETGYDAPPDAVEEEAGQTGPCGPVPQSGTWICYAIPHAPGRFVGMAGAIVGSSSTIPQAWKNPLVGLNGVCVASTANQEWVMCKVDGNQPDAQVVAVVFAPGTSPSSSSPMDDSSCGLTCAGTAVIYHEGQAVGWLLNEQTTGNLHYIQSFEVPARWDLSFNL